MEFKFLLGIGLGTLNFLFDPTLHYAVLALVVLTIADLITGLVVVWQDPKRKIESRELVVTAIKLSMFAIGILSGRMLEISIGGTIGFIDDTIVGIFAASEFLSVMENLSAQGYKVPTQIINKLSNWIEKK
jgi:phage-related holin